MSQNPNKSVQAQRFTNAAFSSFFHALEKEGFSINDLDDVNELEKIIMRDLDDDLDNDKDEE